MTEQTLIWIDIETTGLDPQLDHILEVAVMTSQLSDSFNAKPLYHAVLGYRRDDWSRKIDPFVLEMHTKNRLFEECSKSNIARHHVALDLTKEIPKGSILAGSSVHFDRAFIEEHFLALRLHAPFSHRHYDVSAIKLFCESLGMPRIPKGEAHRAKEDVLESVAHAQRCAGWLAERRSGVV